MKRLTLLDIIIIIFVLTAAIGFVVTTFCHSGIGGGNTVHIDTPTAAYEYPLDKNQTLEIKGSEGVTVIEIRDKSIRFVSSPCPGKTCVGIGTVSSPHIPIVCLPNGVSAYITGKAEFDAISR